MKVFASKDNCSGYREFFFEPGVFDKNISMRVTRSKEKFGVSILLKHNRCYNYRVIEGHFLLWTFTWGIYSKKDEDDAEY